MKKKPKVRLDQHIVNLGLACNISKAQALIIARSVEISSSSPLKPGTLVETSEKITIKKSNPYVSRGGLKLESAMASFGVQCKDKICMDIGASTGGFTDYMLQHGAKLVYAVDVGQGLLDYGLAGNPKVKKMENINFRYFSNINLKEKIEFVTIDVSFISLEKILPKTVEILEPGGMIVAMVKPQFEAAPKDVFRGVVKNEGARLSAIEKIRKFSKNIGLEVLGEADSGIKGPRGNLEHFIWMKKK
jgi:23S rRNA (cytidine1920-2'-O)/16S rRNA (cytidine1409-2'-O)-methyltransferase